MTTAKHRGQAHPWEDTVKLDTGGMKALLCAKKAA
jgi:hypothetical protein